MANGAVSANRPTQKAQPAKWVCPVPGVRAFGVY